MPLESRLKRILAILSMLAAAGVNAAEPPETAAARAARAWLALVDAARYGESWDRASIDFQGAVTKEKWIEAVTGARAPLGKFEKRTLETARAVKDPPGAPAGEYVICQFEANFQNKNGAAETVVMGLNREKEWRASGYFVK